MQTSEAEMGGTEEQWTELLERYHEDESLRTRIHDGDASEVLSDLGITMPDHMEVRIVADTDDVSHVIFPADPNKSLSDEQLTSVVGGETAGSLACVGSLSSFPSSVSSALSAGSVSSATS